LAEIEIKKAKKKGFNGESVFWPSWLFILICNQFVSGEISYSSSKYSGVDTVYSRELNPETYWFSILFSLTILAFLVRRVVRKYIWSL